MTIFLFVVILAVLIISHELGHFIAAKKVGARVDEFGLGFPPRLIAKRWGETDYSLNIIPFGGFVKIFGETLDDDSLTGPESKRSLAHKPRWAQAIVLAAGVTCNFLLAWLLLSVGFLAGLPTPVSEIAPGDRATPAHLLVTTVLPASPAGEAGLKPGDEIIRLATQTKTPAVLTGDLTPAQVQAFIAAHGGQDLEFSYKRGAIFKTTDLPVEKVIVRPVEGLVAGKAAIGIGMDEIAQVRKPLLTAFWDGAHLTFNLTYLTAVSLANLVRDIFAGQNVLGEVAGPVGLVGLVGDARTMGWVYLLSFAALISINLAVLNLVPFPALDGGRLLLLLIEKIKGGAIKPKVANALNLAGFVLLIALMLIVTASDIWKLVG